MKEFTVFLRYLDKKARMPRLPQGLLGDMHAWARQHLFSNLLTIHSAPKEAYAHMGVKRIKRPSSAKKTFQIHTSSLPYELKRHTVKAYFVPKENESSVEAFYDEYKNTIYIFLPYLSEHTKKNLTVDKLNQLDEYLRANLEHEMIHFIQFNTSHEVGGQLKFHKDYDSLKEDYYLSPVEYKALLSNAIHDFRIQYGNNYTKQDIENFLQQDNFFSALKSREPVKYKKSVKDFYILLPNRIL